MPIDIAQLKKLREETGAGVMDVRRAMEESAGDEAKARVWLKERALKTADKKADRETHEGIIAPYVHTTGKVAAMVALTCETDFVAKTEDFKNLGREVAMQVASMAPETVEELLAQPYIREPKTSIQELVKQTIAKVGENITVRAFHRMTI